MYNNSYSNKNYNKNMYINNNNIYIKSNKIALRPLNFVASIAGICTADSQSSPSNSSDKLTSLFITPPSV